MALIDGDEYPVVYFLGCDSVFRSRFQQLGFEYIDVSPFGLFCSSQKYRIKLPLL